MCFAGKKMRYAAKNAENEEFSSLKEPVEAVLEGLGYSLIELIVSRHKGSAQIRAVIYRGEGIGVDDCSKAHRAIMPRLELAFQGQDIYLEVSSPGIERLIKDGKEAARYKGKTVRCYRTDISDWTAGILESADEKEITLKTKDGVIKLDYEIIAKAKLDSAGG
jgi:ribosome maturation factor RimP